MNYKNLLFFNKLGHQSNLKWNGDFWEARLLLNKVSIDLFELEHYFIVEKFLDGLGNTVYGYPHITPDTTSLTSASEIYGNFTAGSNIIKTDVSPLSDYVGSLLFSSQFPGGTQIVSIDPVKNIIQISDSASRTESTSPLFFNLWRTSFETTSNVLDFDSFPPFLGDVTSGSDYIVTSSDISSIKTSNDYLLILGDGIPKNARIVKVDGNKIYLNRVCNVSIKNATIFVYPVEERNNVSSYMFQYNLLVDPTLDQPVLNSVQTEYFKLGYDAAETDNNGVRSSNYIDSSSIQVNIAMSSPDEGIFGRTLVIEDLSLGYPKLVARLEIHGETVGEDERLKVLLSNFGRKLNSEDAFILRDSDPEEPLSDYELINLKRKELLLEGHEIYPYLGSYKGLINAIKFFGYYDLRVKEYWLNVKKSSAQKSSLQENSDFISKLKSTPKDQTTLIANIIDDENSGKYKQVLVYGKNNDGTYGIQPPIEKLFPSSSYKKTSLFGLFYDINEVVPGEFDQFGYPIVQDAFIFSPEEVLIKLFALKDKLKKDFLPLNARIIDITGEGVYFSIYKTRGWIDQLKIDELNQGLDVEVSFSPDYGYVEDLRPFGIRTNNQLPYVPYVGVNYNDFSFSTYGNSVLPSSSNPILPPSDSKKMADAINSFYFERNGEGVNPYRLGDGDSKNGGYYKLSDGKLYEVPAGFPTVLEVTSFNLSWEELNNKWENLDRNVSTYSTLSASISDIPGYNGDTLVSDSLTFLFDFSTIFGDEINLFLPAGINFLNPINPNSISPTPKVQLLFTSTVDTSYKFLMEVQSYNPIGGYSLVKLLWSNGQGVLDTWKVELTNIFDSNLSLDYYDYSFNPNGFYSWDNLRFAGFYEIEWTVTKNDATPFKYQFRGRISDYYKLPMFLPYTGKYSVKCRVWNGFNDICTGYFNEAIQVDAREIELTNIARFREAEVYSWENTTDIWDSYQSNWVFPVEKRLIEKEPSAQVMNFSEYGNQFREGQECRVLKNFPETRGSTSINIGLKRTLITGLTSNYPGGGIGPAIVTIDPAYLPHPFYENEEITLIDNYNTVDNLTGLYNIDHVTSTGFRLPITLSGTVDPSLFSIVKGGTVSVISDAKTIASVDFYWNLSSTVTNLMGDVNNIVNGPKFNVVTVENSTVVSSTVQDWMKISFDAPFGSGNTYNGKTLDFVTTGALYVYDGSTISQNGSSLISGGINPYSAYINYDFNGDLPVESIRNYGTKQMDWGQFDLLEWDNLYAQTWGMYDYHFNWLGGFSLYNLQSGDMVKVGSSTKGIILGNDLSPDISPNYLDLREACNQLNASTDPGISKFYYEVRNFSRLSSYFNMDGSINVPLTAISLPHSEETEEYPIVTDPTSIYQDFYGNIVMGGVSDVNLWISPTDVHTYTISSDFPGSSPRKVITDDADNWWCYGEMCSVPLVIYDKNNPGKTKILTSSPSLLLSDSSLNLVVPIPKTNFQIICLAVDNLNSNFSMYVKYAQSYSTYPDEYVYKLIEYNSSTKEFNDLSTSGPLWSSLKTYDLGNIITYSGISYVSLSNTNLANTPSTSPLSWNIVNSTILEPIDLSVISIRQLKYEYSNDKSSLWAATSYGISIYDGIKITTLNLGNSGLNSNDIYSITFDELNGKWIGTSSGICYYDNARWGCWTNTSNPELPVGRFRNIVNLGNGRVFFIIQTGNENYQLAYFNGITFQVYVNDPGTTNQFSPGTNSDYDYEDLYILKNSIKSISGTFTKYVNDIFYLGAQVRSGSPYVDPSYWDPTYVGVYYAPSQTAFRKIYYLVPFIHASSKTSGISGWDFVYHLSNRSFGDPTYINNKGIGEAIINFNLIVGPLYNDIVNLGKDPQLPSVDKKSWKMPSWINYDFNKIIDSHPSIDPDDLFLDAPLRDIINGTALNENYWRNSNLPRSSDRNKGNLIDDFEWIIKVGNTQDDKGTKIFVGEDGFVYVTGYFSDVVYFGAKNNLPSTVNTSLSSVNCQSIFVAKYNKFGVIQWARQYGENLSDSSTFDYDYTPTGIKVDNLDNVIVVGYKTKTRNNITGELPGNLYLKWDWNATPIIASTIFTVDSSTTSDLIQDLAIDVVGNVYITGTFSGTLSSGGNSITSTNASEVFVARIEGDGNVKWINRANSGGTESNPSIQIGQSFEDLYLAFNTNDGTNQNLILNRHTSYNFINEWSKSILNINHNGTPVDPHIKVSKNGEIALGATFEGALISDEFNIHSNGNKDIAVFKFNGYKILWAKTVGSTDADYCHDVEIDSDGNIYVLGSYGGLLIASPDIQSPVYYPAPSGDLDIILFKYDSGGTLLDVANSGGIAKDEGISLSLDSNQNLYLTGYISGNANFNNWTTSPSGGMDAFIGKIPSLKYNTGNKIGGVYSWFGSSTWTAGDAKIFDKEFEVPLGTTVVLNPVDSLIPGKKNHSWKLIKDESGDVIIDIKDAQSFIWTFQEVGFYHLYLEIQDSNGNVSVYDKPGYIRVIDHKNPAPGEIVNLVNSDIFRKRSIYEINSHPQFG